MMAKKTTETETETWTFVPSLSGFEILQILINSEDEVHPEALKKMLYRFTIIGWEISLGIDPCPVAPGFVYKRDDYMWGVDLYEALAIKHPTGYVDEPQNALFKSEDEWLSSVSSVLIRKREEKAK